MNTQHRLSIKHFGPINDITGVSIDKIMVLLGEQATGKSTVAKLIYFARSVRDELLDFVCNEDTTQDVEKDAEEENVTKDRKELKEFTKVIKRKFINIFGQTWNNNDFTIEYAYTDDRKLTIAKNKKASEMYFSISFSPNLYSEILKLLRTKDELFSYKQEKESDIEEIALSFRYNKINEYSWIEKIEKQTKRIFNDDFHLFYIPAGRSLLSHENVHSILYERERNAYTTEKKYSYYNTVDALTRDFTGNISSMRILFRQNMDMIIKSFKSLHGFKYEKQSHITEFSELYKRILKGSYIYEDKKEYIVLNKTERIPLSYASSGQQEVLWILNILFFYMLSAIKCFIVVEEPEAHLFPEAQNLLVKAFAIFSSFDDNQLLITTHSPYILMAVNNMMYAAKIGKIADENGAKEIDGVIPRICWLDSFCLSAYLLKNGFSCSIKDDDLALIDISELDKIASINDDEYEKMLNITLGN